VEKKNIAQRVTTTSETVSHATASETAIKSFSRLETV